MGLHPDLLPLNAYDIAALRYETILDGMDHLASLDLPREDSDYAGAFGLMTSFSKAGLRSYNFVLGGENEEWSVPMSKFEQFDGYQAEWNDSIWMFEMHPEHFYFMPDMPCSQWKKLVDLNCHAFPVDVGTMDLSKVLVRLAIVREGYGNYSLVLQAILHQAEDLAAWTKRKSWLLTAQCQPVMLCSVGVRAMEGISEQMEVLPMVLGDSIDGPALSDSALRFACLRSMLDASAIGHHSSFAEWVEYYKKHKHQNPPMLYDSSYQPLFPISTFTFKDGLEEMTVLVGGRSYVISKSNASLIRLVAPSQSDAPLVMDVPDDVGAEDEAADEDSQVQEPAQKKARVDVSSTEPGDSSLALTQPTPSSSSSGNKLRSYENLPAPKKVVDRLPTPASRQKYAVRQSLADQFGDALPQSFAANLSAAWGYDQQVRMESARTLFCGILQRDPFTHPRNFDSIHIFDHLLDMNKSASTLRDLLNQLIKWYRVMNLPMRNEQLIRDAIRGYEHLELKPLRNASKPFSLPWSFPSLKLLAGGLSAMDTSDVKRAAVWSCSLLLFWGLLRTGEVLPKNRRTFDVSSQLCLSDVKFNRDGSIQLWLKLPKVKTERGDVVEIPLLASLVEFCPVRALHNYLAYRHALTDDPDLPLYLVDKGAAMSKETFVSLWKKALRTSNVSEYVVRCHRSHGFRASLPSLLQTADISPDALKLLGRWSSDAYLTYLRDNKARSEARQKSVLFCEKLGQAFLQ